MKLFYLLLQNNLAKPCFYQFIIVIHPVLHYQSFNILLVTFLVTYVVFYVTEQVKIAERVQLNEIPLPDMPAEPGKQG